MYLLSQIPDCPFPRNLNILLVPDTECLGSNPPPIKKQVHSTFIYLFVKDNRRIVIIEKKTRSNTKLRDRIKINLNTMCHI